MAKRPSETQIKEIIKNFNSGKTIDELSTEFNFTKLTISRNLKKNMSEKKYKELINKNKKTNKLHEKNDNYIDLTIKNENNNISPEVNADNKNSSVDNKEEHFAISPFTEIIPLDYEIENAPQKDLTSVPITEVDFPNVVFMIVDKNIELETKYLKDYPEWNFLSHDELNRKTIEIYADQKIAKRFCNKDQKVIKVPNTNVFKIVAPILISRGISRIVSPGNLIAL